MGVLLEGTESGVAERAGRMSELIASAGGTPVVARSEVPFRWWDMVPAAGAPAVVVRVSFWLRRLTGVLEALAAASAGAGVAPVVSGPAGAGVLDACLDPGVPEEDAARFVLVLRDALAVPAGSGPRGSVTVLAAPPAVMTAAGASGPVPGAALMRAVKNQFDPGHRMFPGRLGGS
jgi:glycolate oxidase FAD binding subunit